MSRARTRAYWWAFSLYRKYPRGSWRGEFFWWLSRRIESK